MTHEKMENIIKTEIPFDKLVKNSGIYEFHQVNDMSIGISYEDDENGNDIYIFNIFCGDEYINIGNEGINDWTINELVDMWNILKRE